jgi:hypothetical protein
MVPLAVSSNECIVALTLAGFQLTQRTPTGAYLERGCISIVVPVASVLDPATLTVLLRLASLSQLDFLELMSQTARPARYVRRRPYPPWSR